jgi:hypothetical protein
MKIRYVSRAQKVVVPTQLAGNEPGACQAGDPVYSVSNLECPVAAGAAGDAPGGVRSGEAAGMLACGSCEQQRHSRGVAVLRIAATNSGADESTMLVDPLRSLVALPDFPQRSS